MGFAGSLYNNLFKRTSTFALVCAGAVFFFERTFDLSADTIFEKANEGKLYKDIKDKFP